MFYVSIRTDRTDNRIFYKCPKCSIQSVYFINIPDICSNCGYLLPNPEKMKKSQQARYNYYTFKPTDPV